MGTEIVIVNENTIRDKIYIIRGEKVMLDFDLAEIYGYTTKAFNQQVKRNADKFDDDFVFQLTKKETEELSRSQNVTSIQVIGVKGGRSYLPYAFTESGIYMLMTVLKGDLAIQQSKAYGLYCRQLYRYQNAPAAAECTRWSLSYYIQRQSPEFAACTGLQ